MFKIYSSCLMLTTLVFSIAHAPTFELRHDPSTAAAMETAPSRAMDHAGAPADPFAYASYALSHEYDEHNDLERFELDEFHLPKLDVDLPELFDWSDGDRTYLANNTPAVALTIGLHSTTGYESSNARASGGFGRGGMGYTSGGSAKRDLASSAGYPDDSGPEESTCASSKTAADGEDTCAKPAQPSWEPVSSDDPSPSDPELPGKPIDQPEPPNKDRYPDPDPPREPWHPPPIVEPIEPDDPIPREQEPVQVPAPAPLGLFVLGLAALRLVGRKKNGSG